MAELLERCSRRPADEDAWQVFVRRFHQVIKGTVIRTYRRKAREDADRRQQFPEDLIEDLVQTVYVRLVDEQNRAITAFEGFHENSIYQYLTMISINVVLDYFREVKAQKRPKVSFSLDEMLEKGDGPLISSAISQLDGKLQTGSDNGITMEEIERALAKVVSGKNKDRDVLMFKLRYYEGMTLDEIKKTLNLPISPVSIGSTLNRIASKMRPLLDPKRKKR
ncbi:MAG TPA: sigma-70 family RNA polymerase sigma factor [Blastocatellia bacterium]|nr:sigma-70 family RNA polymerase sigma factor [Blastocatellia bacterium]